jgi:hypothetical protein
MAIDVPEFIQQNAERGLEYNREGKGGDGLVEQTLQDARDMARGSISEAKVRKMAPWFARHLTDMSAPANDPDNEAFPGNGAVAWLLWGGSVSGDKMDAAKWAERTVERLNREKEQSKLLTTFATIEHMDTIESKLSAALEGIVAVTTERDEIRVSFEKLASEQVANIEATKTEIEAKDIKLNELTVAIDGLTAEKAELVARIAALQVNAVSASVEAAKVCASVGVNPIESSPETTDAPKLSLVEQYLSLQGAERSAFFAKHGAAIKAALR